MGLHLFAVCLGCLAASVARADVFYLRDGSTLQAEVLEEKGGVIRVRTALGTYEIKKSQIVRREAAANDGENAASPDPKQQKEIRKIVAGWFVRIKAIAKGKLEGAGNPPDGKNFREGRRLILAIADPFALPALASILSKGRVETRLLLVEALSGFKENEASLDLVVMAILDEEPAVRLEAARVLGKRKDSKIVSALRHALGSDREFTVRNAATALGIIGAREAAADLVSVLTTEGVEVHRNTQYVFLDALFYDFGGTGRYAYANRFLNYRAERIWCYDTLDYIHWINGYEAHLVTIPRTEVQESLIALTGQNFGFDAAKWREWLAKH